MNNLFKIMMAIFFSLSVHAEDIQLKSKKERRHQILNISVWQGMQTNLTAQDIFDGPEPEKDYENLLMKDRVFCKTNEEDQQKGFGGVTSKFYCQLMKETKQGLKLQTRKGGAKRRVIKVKYSQSDSENREIQGEIIGTRLLWALGFYADTMRFVNEVHCFGCSADPFSQRMVDKSTLENPRIFTETAVETKLDGDEIVYLQNKLGKEIVTQKPKAEDWSAGIKFSELMKLLPPKDRYEELWHQQLAERDALRLLAVFMNHVDLKSSNQRMMCLQKNSRGECIRPIAMIQDIGSSFGVKTQKGKSERFKKVDLEVWRSTPIWTRPDKCSANMSSKDLLIGFGVFSFDSTMSAPIISESGRKFLLKLLDNFIKDPNRVRALFRAARIDENKIEDWTHVFLEKVESIRYPMGRGRPDFSCPISWNERKAKTQKAIYSNERK